MDEIKTVFTEKHEFEQLDEPRLKTAVVIFGALKLWSKEKIYRIWSSPKFYSSRLGLWLKESNP